MLATQRTRRTREHTGPTPHSVSIRAKMPSSKLPEHLLLERRRQEDLREEAILITKYNKMFDLKNDWERITDRSIQKNTVQRRVKDLMEQRKLELDERRQKLRELLSAEDEEYVREMEAKHETLEERQNKMCERAKLLKAKRETERQAFVEEKLDQQWREQCEELRGVLSRRHQDEVCVDRMQQLAAKADLERRKQEEEAMYAQLWEKDRLAKAAREEQEAQQQIERNRAMVDTLRTQKASLQAKKLEEKRLIAEEAKLLIEERELRSLEEERASQQKRLLQKQHKSSLEKSMKLKLQREAKEQQEELALDMKILEQLLEESRNEAHEMVERKHRRREEEQKYREFLQQQLEEETRREKELDRLIDVDVAAMWSKRIHQWKLEKEARNRLMRDVMETRRKQLQEKLQKLAYEKEVLKRDCEEIMAAVEEHNKLEDERVQRTKMINKNYESDLLAQIDHQKSKKDERKMEELREYNEGLQTEAKYQQRLKNVLSSATSERKTHPMRRPQFEVTGQKMV
uniref:cilia- and flagella-associated protein 53 n=1 Tax=Ciona intestinalis TaxID=7719 RepID=UPI00005210FA|nr:cilia- and flagella-associated protein 53 [Ciona intestinalis]|eukprot:XP_004226085.1 cilia- and flagella-associated protein 53 [Ciona intestinalis]